MLFWQMKLDMQKRETQTAFCIMMSLAVISFFVSAHDGVSCGGDVSELLPAYAYGMLHMSTFNTIGTMYLILTPLAVSIPFAGGLGEYGTLGYGSILLGRCSKHQLITAKAGSAFFIGALMVALPAALNFMWCIIAFPLESIRNPIGAISSMPVIDHFLNMVYLVDLYLAHPYLYSLLGVLSAGLYGGLCSLFTLAISLKRSDKHRVIIGTVPFFLVLLISLIGYAYQGLTGGAVEIAPVYSYFITADDTRKIALPLLVSILALVAVATCISIGIQMRRKDEL